MNFNGADIAPGDRRRFLKAASGCVASAMLGNVAPRVLMADDALARAAAEGPDLPRPTPAQLRWQDCELGLIYHFDMPVAAGAFASNNQTRRTFDPALYNPVKLDTDQWIEAAKAAGARYAVFTATHFNGFMQWQSDLYVSVHFVCAHGQGGVDVNRRTSWRCA